MKHTGYIFAVVASTVLLEAVVFSGSFALTTAVLPVSWPLTLFGAVPLWFSLIAIPLYCALASLPLLLFSIHRQKIWLITQIALIAAIVVLFFIVGRKIAPLPYM